MWLLWPMAPHLMNVHPGTIEGITTDNLNLQWFKRGLLLKPSTHFINFEPQSCEVFYIVTMGITGPHYRDSFLPGSSTWPFMSDTTKIYLGGCERKGGSMFMDQLPIWEYTYLECIQESVLYNAHKTGVIFHVGRDPGHAFEHWTSGRQLSTQY